MTDPPLHNRVRGFTAEALADIRRRYVETDETTASIAELYSVNRNTITETVKRQGWPMRRDRPPRELPAALRDTAPAESAGDASSAAEAAMLDAAAADKDALPLALRLEQAVVRELARVERRNAAGGTMRPSESERIARTLSTLTQTLFKVRALREPGSVSADAQPDDMPADLDGFRDALARRIEAFVASRADDGLAGAGEPSGRAPPAA
jgi:transposase-like protein